MQVGDSVQARFGGGAEWYGGVIEQVHGDGTFGVAYADGEP